MSKQRSKRQITVDMFRNDWLEETCVLLVRESISDDDMVSIKVDLEGISLNQGKQNPNKKTTYGSIMRYIKEKYGFNVSSNYIAQIKDKAGLKKRRNYHIGSGQGRVLICPPEKEEAIMDAFRHFNLIQRSKAALIGGQLLCYSK